MSQNIRLKLRGFDNRLVEESVRNILLTIVSAGGSVLGPVPLPRKIKRFTVLRSPHVDKKSREQFEIRICECFMILSGAAHQTTEALMSLELPAGVEVEIGVVE